MPVPDGPPLHARGGTGVKPAVRLIASTLCLWLVACGGGPPEATSLSPPDLEPADWYTDEEMATLPDADGTVWLTGWFVPEALADPGVADLEPRFRRTAMLTDAAPPAEWLAAALAALGGPGPVDLLNPLEGTPLPLASARLDDGDATLTLDFAAAVEATNALFDVAAAEAQFLRTVAHSFPDAQRLVVTVEGDPAALFGHDGWGDPVTLPT